METRLGALHRGHPHPEVLPLDTETTLGTGTLYVTAGDVFDAEEAAGLFLSYHQSGAIPETYSPTFEATCEIDNPSLITANTA